MKKSCIAVVLALGTLSSAATAQAADSTRTVAREPLFRAPDAALAAGFAVASIAMMPLDRKIAVEIQEPGSQTNHALKSAATGFRFMGSGGALLIGGSLYAVGRLGHNGTSADIGLHTLEAITIGALATNVIKGLTGRARPYAVSDTNPGDIQFTRGFRKGSAYTSFPSGHTTVAFALASTLTAETHRRWRGSTWFVAPLTYGTATLVGASRLYNNAHWASDVIIGAGIGTFSGLKVVRYNHAHEGNRLDRWLLATSLVPLGPKAAALTWSFKP